MAPKLYGQSNEFYVPSLDGLRACAFLLVFVAHSGLDKIVPGGFGVTVFFFLSGYLITSLLRLEYEKTGTISLRNFYLRRSIRILPPMYITLAVGFAAGYLRLLPTAGNAVGFVSAIFYFSNYASLLHPGVANLPAGLGLVWSLMVEEHFYLLFPLLYLSFGRLGISRRAQVGMLVGLCAAALLWRCYLVFVVRIPLTTFSWTYAASDCRFDSILWGCVLAIATNPAIETQSELDGNNWLRKFSGPLACGGLVFIVLTLLWREPHWRETFRYTGQSLALYPIFYYCIASQQNLSVRWLSSKPMRWVGWTSYSMYLVHMMVLTAFTALGFHHSVERGFLALGISMLYATAMRWLVESPLRRLRQAKARPLRERLVSIPA